MSKALLMLEDGTSFMGEACGAKGEVFGELCFNTSMIGYPEIISDPNAAGHLITMTYPQIGNYGIARADLEHSEVALRGLILRDICTEPSNFRSDLSLPDFLREQGVVAVSELDTRAITQHIRSFGSLRAGISTLDFDAASLLAKVKAAPGLAEQELVQTASVKEPQAYAYDSLPQSFVLGEAALPTRKVVVYDCGAPQSMLRNIAQTGSEITLVPWDTPASEVLALEPAGIFFSSGPGSPEQLKAPLIAAQELLGKVPLFGIGLGHQVLAMAVGSSSEKLKCGHRGGNQPVMNLCANIVEITTQNHGFSVRFESLGTLVPELSGGQSTHPSSLLYWVEARIAPVVETAHFGRVQLTHVNLNDGATEALVFLDVPALSVQYHPEASLDPDDTHNFYTRTALMMNGQTELSVQDGQPVASCPNNEASLDGLKGGAHA